MNNQNNVKPDIELFSHPYFFFSNNSDSELIYVSPSVEHVLGYRPDEIIGRNCAEFLDASSPLNADVPDCRKIKYQGTENRNQLRVVETRDKNLKVLKLQTYGKQNAKGHISIQFGIAQDVTEIYFVEQEMHNRLVDLEKADRQLSERERFVLDRVAEGMLNKTIARKLDISERSVEKIRSRLVEKFDAETMLEVISKATELRILHDVILLVGETQDAQGSQTASNKPASRLMGRQDQGGAGEASKKGGNPN